MASALLFAAVLAAATSATAASTIPVAAAPASPASARALLIGVGDYPSLPARLRLRAPAGDVQRLRAALVSAGLAPAAVTVMTEHEGQRPTRAAMLAALRRLAADAQPGQQVLVYFSGHGAQAPARHPAREPDGLEELYLASDASGWDDGARTVQGAVADFELEALLAAIQAKGAMVWFVADACHAAGLTRSAAPAGARAKSVSGADLGIPASVLGRRAVFQEPAPLEPSGFAGFYAASPGALALERPMPVGADDAQSASVFTFALAKALNQGRFRTLRDLALAVSASELDTGAGAPAPVFEGGLDSAMLGLAPTQRSFRVHRAKGRLLAQAGAVEGLERGASMVLLDAAGHPFAHVRVAVAGLDLAELDYAGPVPDGALSARLEGPPAPEGGRGRRLLAALAPLAGGDSLSVEARLLRKGCTPNPAARLGFPADARPLDLLAAPSLRHCDVLYIRIENLAAASRDVSPLYVDASGGVVGLALAPEDDVRLLPGQVRFVALRLVTRDGQGHPLPQGIERLALVSAPAADRRLDLRGLAGPAVTRGVETAPLLDRKGLDAQVFALRVQD